MKISPSILSVEDRTDAIYKLNNTSCDYIHIDVMDGTFVPNYQMPIEEILDYEKISKKPLDIHLMVENPEDYLDKLANKNIEYITFHYEIAKDIDKILNIIKNMNYKVGLAIKPKTDINEIIPFLNKIDMLLIMTVEPGLGGQKFMPEMIEKANKVKKISNVTIEMDGGINDETIKNIKNIIDISVVGSYITNKDDYNKAINTLKN